MSDKNPTQEEARRLKDCESLLAEEAALIGVEPGTPSREEMTPELCDSVEKGIDEILDSRKITTVGSLLEFAEDLYANTELAGMSLRGMANIGVTDISSLSTAQTMAHTADPGQDHTIRSTPGYRPMALT